MTSFTPASDLPPGLERMCAPSTPQNRRSGAYDREKDFTPLVAMSKKRRLRMVKLAESKGTLVATSTQEERMSSVESELEKVTAALEDLSIVKSKFDKFEDEAHFSPGTAHT